MAYFSQETSSCDILEVQAASDQICRDDQRSPVQGPHSATWLRTRQGPTVYEPHEDAALCGIMKDNTGLGLRVAQRP